MDNMIKTNGNGDKSAAKAIFWLNPASAIVVFSWCPVKHIRRIS